MSDENLDFSTINRDYFRYSILAEPDNQLIPTIFSIYLDRVFYRFNDGALDSSALIEIFDVAKEESIKKHRKEIYAQLFTRYFMLIKLRQQEIASLATTSNKTIRKSSKTLDKVKKSLVEYNSLIKGVDLMVQNMISSPVELKDEDKKNFEHFYSLLNNYKDDEKRLSRLVEELDKFHNHKFSVSVN
jgi:alanyl-tRNA synthetase